MIEKPETMRFWKPVMKATEGFPMRFRKMVFYYKHYHWSCSIESCIRRVKATVRQKEKEEKIFKRWQKELREENEGKCCPFCQLFITEKGDCCNRCFNIFESIR
jgi:hypothetical protein